MESAKSVFDPKLDINGIVSDQKTKPEDSESMENKVQASIGKKFSYGTNVSLSFTKTDKTVKTDFLEDEDSSSALSSLIISQPLLKNRGNKVNKRNIIVAENNVKKSELSLKQTIIDMITQTQNLYWQLYSAIESLSVQKKSLELAKRFLEEVETKIELGGAARLDALQAKAEVASREELVIISENKVNNSQEALLMYIYGNLKSHTKVGCKQVPYFKSIHINKEKLLEKALKVRTDYLSTQIDLNSAQVDLHYYKNQKLPNLDFNASVNYFDGRTDAQPPSDSQYKDYYSGSLSLNLQFPWGFRQDKANYSSALHSNKQYQILLEEIKAQVTLEVNKAVRDVEANHKRCEAASLAKNLADEKLKAEEEKYKKGLSTSYNVLLYQRDFTNAMVNWVDAVIEYQIAIINLYKSVGITLEKNNIQLKEAA